MAFKGSCHCGRLAYTVDEDLPTEAMAVQLLDLPPPRRASPFHHAGQVQLRGRGVDVAGYKWNTQNISFEFCSTCGCAPFAHGTGPNGPMVEINLRCAEDIDLDSLRITAFDGAHKLPGPVG